MVGSCTIDPIDSRGERFQPMNAHERIRQVIDEREARLVASVPPTGQAPILALVRAVDRQPHALEIDPSPDFVTGYRRASLGGAKALQLCLESIDDDTTTNQWESGEALDDWADQFLEACRQLAEAELVQTHCQTGFMRMIDDGNGTFDAWIATKRVPASWRERADIDWWASSLSRRHGPELRNLCSRRHDADSNDPGHEGHDRQLTDIYLARMAYQLPYPPAATISGLAIETWRNILGWLIGWAVRERGESPEPRTEQSVIDEMSSSLSVDPGIIEHAVAAFTLDRGNAAWHAAVPGAMPPLVRIGPDLLLPSFHGLTTEPLFFLTRELRRRNAEAYHNTAHLREVAFRQDLFALFQDKRFMTSAGRIELRRDSGNIRTDIDAVVFDRKTGTLGVFELKSPDPFARSAAELTRQRDNVLYANRQISGVLDWLKRHGADAILDRIDRRTAKTFRVQKVYPFVIGRYLVHFNDGPQPDRRAAWGTWPQVLRLVDGQQFASAGANPLASLHTRLPADTPIIGSPTTGASHEIDLGASRLIVHPSYAALQASASDDETT
ncbi:MAG: hypothetical protein M3490_04335 [Chloroflexota bacterium]|nr:hypothetical protein [Chloroflexota bacterium]